MHAVSLLTVELFELFDKSRFELYGFCWSREDGSEVRARIKSALDHFVPIGGLDDATAARLIRQHEIDALIDLQGLTSGARPDIIAARPAPVQMTYLGFPGPTGMPSIDHVFADRYLIPDSQRPLYSEVPLYLPGVYQCSDRKRPVGARPSRAACGLPEQGVVFCCFNNNYKFTPEMFATWMRILARVPGSVLWLLADNPWARENLLGRAAEAGIDPSRLVFGARLAPPDYLARYAVADLFLDCFPFNAGTTANDALFMGLPVLTLSGRAFASRMAGALLTALGVPELISHTLSDYEERAVALGSDPAALTALRSKVESARTTSPLFDMPRFVTAFCDVIEKRLRKS
jgi:predicted O-linked N-acetylglucosamine transferase (SPINDLY family)